MLLEEDLVEHTITNAANRLGWKVYPFHKTLILIQDYPYLEIAVSQGHIYDFELESLIIKMQGGPQKPVVKFLTNA